MIGRVALWTVDRDRTRTSAAHGAASSPHRVIAWQALLALRAFLAVAFLYAGLQKLANPQFFDAASLTGIHAQLAGAIETSPVRALLRPLLGDASAIGLVIALGEVAVGIGLALGLFTRVAAIGGALISLSLFLTVSFHDSPWFTGPDIVYLFALTPFVIAGAGGAYSLDAVLARRAARDHGAGDPRPVAVAFSVIQGVCGAFDAGRCTAVTGRACAPSGCPYLEGMHGAASAPPGRAVHRRQVVVGGVATAAGVALAGVVAASGRIIDDAKAGPHGTVDSITPTTPVLLGAVSAVPVGLAGSFTLPSGLPVIVLQPSAGEFRCYDAVCPHAGCTVGYDTAQQLILCPCHGSEFAVATGDVLRGPAVVGLTALHLEERGDRLYVT